MARRLVSRTVLAELAGVSRSAVTKALKVALKEGVVGDRVDAAHPVIVEWLVRHGAQPPEPLPPPPRVEQRPAERRDPVGPEITEELADLTIRRIVELHGTNRAFKDWLDAMNRIENMRKTRLDNDESEGRLVDRDLVKQSVFGAIDSAHIRLLQDTPKTAIARIYAAAKAGQPPEDAEKILRDLISAQLKPLKAKASAYLRRKPAQ